MTNKQGDTPFWTCLNLSSVRYKHKSHDDVFKWKHFPRYWPFALEIHRSPVHKGPWRGTLMFLLIYTWLNGWVNNRDAGDLRPNRAHYDVTVMISCGRPHPYMLSLFCHNQVRRALPTKSKSGPGTPQGVCFSIWTSTYQCKIISIRRSHQRLITIMAIPRLPGRP